MTKDNNSQNDPSTPEYWESLGIKPIIIDPNDSKDVEEKAQEISDRIREAAEDIKRDKD